MENIKDIEIGPMPESNFLKPLRMTFNQNGKKRYWDFIKQHESVTCILFNTDRQVLVFVKQFRPAVYYGTSIPPSGDNSLPTLDWSRSPPPTKNGITLELCAGIVDEPTLSLVETIRKEVLEECGYDVPLDKFEKVITYRSGVGVMGDKSHMYYAEIKDGMKVHEGGGLEHEGEYIDVVEMTITQIQDYIGQEDVQSPGGFIFAILWFLTNKASKVNANSNSSLQSKV